MPARVRRVLSRGRQRKGVGRETHGARERSGGARRAPAAGRDERKREEVPGTRVLRRHRSWNAAPQGRSTCPPPSPPSPPLPPRINDLSTPQDILKYVSRPTNPEPVYRVPRSPFSEGRQARYTPRGSSNLLRFRLSSCFLTLNAPSALPIFFYSSFS